MQAGILNAISLRERGLSRNSSYKADTRDVVVNKVQCASQLIRFSTEDTFYCNSFTSRSRFDGSVIAVFQNQNQTNSQCYSLVYGIQFLYNSPCSPISPLPIISGLLSKSRLREDLLITETADAVFAQQRPLLIVGNSNKGRKTGVAILSFFNCEYGGPDLEWRFKWQINCCACCAYREQFALGCFGGYYLFDTRYTSRKYELSDDVLSLEFNDTGNLLLISCSNNGIMISDMREDPKYGETPISRRPSSFGKAILVGSPPLVASKMKLLSDQVSLVARDIEGKISMIDTRMRKSIFEYSDHVEYNSRSPLSLNEDLELISGIDKDNIARLWSLKSGKLRFTQKVVMSEEHGNIETNSTCCIIAEQRRWFLAMLNIEYMV